MCLSEPELELFAVRVLLWSAAAIGMSCAWARRRAPRVWLFEEPVAPALPDTTYRGVDPTDAPTVTVRGRAIQGAELGVVWRLGLLAALLLSPALTGLFALAADPGSVDAPVLRCALGLAGLCCWLTALDLIRARPRYLRVAAWTSRALLILSLLMGLPGLFGALVLTTAAPLLGLVSLALLMLVVGACLSTIDGLERAGFALRRNLARATGKPHIPR